MGGLQHYSAVRGGSDILAISADLSSKHFVAWFELSHILSHRFNGSRVVDTQTGLLWLASTNHEPDPRRSAHCKVQWIYRCSANLNENLIVIRNRFFDFLELQDIFRSAVLAVTDNFHGMRWKTGLLIAVIG